MNAAVVTTWAFILQRYTDTHTPIHHLPAVTRSLLELRAGDAPAVPPHSDVSIDSSSEHYSCRLVLDADKDPLFSLCSRSVVTLLLTRIVELGMSIAFGLTGQVSKLRNLIGISFQPFKYVELGRRRAGR